jgi:hypothetical protein
MAEMRKVRKISQRRVWVSAYATAVPRRMGMIATLYMGGLMAAIQSFLEAGGVEYLGLRDSLVMGREFRLTRDLVSHCVCMVSRSPGDLLRKEKHFCDQVSSVDHRFLALDPPNPLNKGASEFKVPLIKGNLRGSNTGSPIIKLAF